MKYTSTPLQTNGTIPTDQIRWALTSSWTSTEPPYLPLLPSSTSCTIAVLRFYSLMVKIVPDEDNLLPIKVSCKEYNVLDHSHPTRSSAVAMSFLENEQRPDVSALSRKISCKRQTALYHFPLQRSCGMYRCPPAPIIQSFGCL